MSLRIVGAGLGRTGTLSLKTALEQLLGGPCYHMIEVFGRPDDVAVWQGAIDGEAPDWDALFDGYAAAVDWPTCEFWRELSEQYPDAPVLLSTRSSAAAWWKSADETIFEVSRGDRPDDPVLGPHHDMVLRMLDRFTPGWSEATTAMAAYDAHNAAVRAAIPADRLVEWSPGDGWGPLCAALDLPVPEEPFPHVNSTDEFRTMAGLDDAP